MLSRTKLLFFSIRQQISTQQKLKHTKIGIIGAPFDKGQRKEGAGLGPGALRQSGLVKHLVEIGCDVLDYGDVEYQPTQSIDNTAEGKVRNVKDVIEYNRNLSNSVCKIIRDGRMCLTLGGDHSIGVGTVHGHLKAQPETSLLWVDAHADINTPATSHSGNAHGMPVSFHVIELSEYIDKTTIPGFEWHTPMISAKNIAFIGLRDVDPYERLIIEKLGICALSMEEVHGMGIKEAVKHALNMIDPRSQRNIHISFDIDALDPLEAPSTGTPVRGGLTLREGTEILRSVHRTGRLSAVDIVEVNPLLGSEVDKKITLDAARHLAAAAVGFYPGGWPPKNVTEIPR